MIKHIVLWRLKEEYEGETKPQMAAMLKRELESMKGVIPEIRHLEVGLNQETSDMAVDLALYSEFDSWEDLQTYQDHPVHQRFKSVVMNRRTERRVADYEV